MSSETALGTAETRLGVALPASYRRWVAEVGDDERTAGRLGTVTWLPLEAIGRFSAIHPDLVAAWHQGVTSAGEAPAVDDEQYFVYGEEQDVSAIRHEYLDQAILIGTTDEPGFLLLNPQVIRDGEWEAWFFAAWLPGAERYRSFAEMVQAWREETD